MNKLLNPIVDPDPAAVGNNVEEFLAFLGGPTSILFTGTDDSRTRAMVTLLHGNEPSGCLAVYRWIKSGRRPAVNVLCILASVEAAQTPPLFSHRLLPPKPDLNRCFKEPYAGEQGRLAKAILDCLAKFQPEAVVDVHNTSGSGPSFSVVTHADENHDALASLFTQRMIVTHLRMGALMEISESLFPTVTIECGGRLDGEAHETAWDGVCRYFESADVLHEGDQDWGMEVLHNPVRLELNPDISLAFREQHSLEYDLVLPPSIENHNAGVTPKDTHIGWLGDKRLEDIFRTENSREQCVLNEMLYLSGQKLFTRQDLKLFMVTGDATIAKMDCLFYAVKSDGQEIVQD